MYDPSDMMSQSIGHGYNSRGEVHDMRAGIRYDNTEDKKSLLHYGKAKPARLSIMERIAENVEANGTLSDREHGTYTMWPSRPRSAQTRLKNLQYELPSYNWTNSPEGPVWAVRVPALPHIKNLNTMNNYTVQRDFLPLVPNLQAQTQETWYNKIKQALFNNAANQSGQAGAATLQQIYPSIFQNQLDI